MDIWGRIGGEAGKVIADAWTSIMLTLWNAGLYVLGVVLRFEQHFLTPDVSEAGPGKGVFGYTFWIAAALVVVLLMVQLGAAALRRDAKSLARAAVGVGQFGLVWLTTLGYGALVVSACGAINDTLMRALFHVDSWDAWQPWASFSVADITDAAVATVLGVLGLLLWLAALAHCLVILARGGALIVLTATSPISAAGLVMESTRSWFWKALRWFHAAAFAPILMTLLMGLGVQATSGVALGYTDTSQAAIGTALPGVLMILIAAVAPVALFKLLAFVDPGTNSGAAVRAGLAAMGGLGGLARGTQSPDTDATAAQADGNGRSQGEQASDAETAHRASSAQASLADRLGPIGQTLGDGIRSLGSAGAGAAAVGSDTTNQMGVGHNTYQPDVTSAANAASVGQLSPDDPTPPQQADPGSTGGDPVTPEPSTSPGATPLAAALAPLPAGVPSSSAAGAEAGVGASGAADAAVLII